MVIFYILTTLSLDNVWTLLGENCCWSLLGLKGLKHFSYLFGAKFSSRKFNRKRHDDWPIGQWVIFHAAPGTLYVNHFFPREFIIWLKSIQAKQVDLETSSLARSLGERGRLAILEKSGVYLSHVKPLKSPQPSLLDWSILSSLVKLVFRVLASAYWTTLLFGEAIMETSIAFLNFESVDKTL